MIIYIYIICIYTYHRSLEEALFAGAGSHEDGPRGAPMVTPPRGGW